MPNKPIRVRFQFGIHYLPPLHPKELWVIVPSNIANCTHTY